MGAKKDGIMAYPFIFAWGRYLGSNDDFIFNEIAAAKEDNAPPTAIYKDRVGEEWRTVGDINGRLGRILFSNQVYLIFWDYDPALCERLLDMIPQ